MASGARFTFARAEASAWLAMAVITGVLFFLHGSALNGSWRIDDPHILQFVDRLPDLHSAFLNAAVWQGIGVPFFTPMLTLDFQLDQWVFGLAPWGFYLHHLLVLLLIAALTFSLVASLAGRWAGLGSAVLFLLGAPTAVVAQQLMSRHYAVGLVWALLSLGLWLRWLRTGHSMNWIGSVALYLVAMLCKEVYAPLPLVLLTIDTRPGLQRFRHIGGHAAAAVAFVAWRSGMIGATVGGYTGSLAQPGVLLDSLRTLPEIFWGAGWPGYVGSAAVVVSCLVLLIRYRLAGARVVASVVGMVLLPFVAINASTDVVSYRFGFFPWWALSVLLGVAASAVREVLSARKVLRWVSVVAIVGLCGLTGLKVVDTQAVYRPLATSYDVQARFLMTPTSDRWFVPAGMPAGDLHFQSGMFKLGSRLGIRPPTAMPFAEMGVHLFGLAPVYMYQSDCRCMQRIDPAQDPALATPLSLPGGLVAASFERPLADGLIWRFQTSAVQPHWFLVFGSQHAAIEVPAQGQVKYSLPKWWLQETFRVAMRADSGVWTVTPELPFPQVGNTISFP